ncbi:MAG: filamentous hemagglutinin N-terminal domain-containing protein, partial [Cyanobacteria bacterium]|nr:filamentous hemagglutinin N-terminal domain-containing protein [Cyanobacteriota bacterium]
MHKNLLNHGRTKSQGVPLTVLFGLTLLTASPAWAQTVVIDGTTPTVLSTGDCSTGCTITGGTAAGGNLFHSFTDFGVAAGTTVTFQDSGATNIIGRVTGSNSSLINGTLGATGTANLFLFNPNGITFGTGATLSLGGSFIGSTASGIEFQDGSFSLTDSSAASSLLAVNVPTGLQVGTGAGDIVVNGTGNNLFINQDLSVVDALFAPDLAVNAQQTLALVGGNVTLNGANLVAPGGRVDIGSVNSGLVSLATATNGDTPPVNVGFQLGYGGVSDFGDITLQNAAAIDVTAASAGSVQLRGQQVSLSGGSAVFANTSGGGAGGSVQVTADALSVAGASTFVPGFLPPAAAPFVVMPSGIFASVEAGATGGGSQINLNVGQLSLTAGAQIAASTFGVGSGGNPGGNAGNLNVNAETITVDGGRPAGPSGLFTTVAPGPAGDGTGAANGNGGNLTITMTGPGELFIRNGGQISAGTFGEGNAGSLTVNASLIEVTGSFTGGGPSSLRSASERPWAGAGGTVDVT